ncbi:MAG: DUF2461 domain-containing protein [Myxococcales bacterium]|nr:DUF2461 domain-containing protein [Myxococcales bacterium]
MAPQPHFTSSLFQFLRELRDHNDRAWFQANKARYESEVRDPALRFISDFGPRLRRLSEHFMADPRPVGGSLMRIHRDTRFAKDKSPYKTNVGIQFRHDAGKDVHAPGFYLHLDPDSVFAGVGLWQPDPPTLAKLRGALVDGPEHWKKAISGKRFLASWALEGESLKRPPAGFAADHPLIADLKRKDFIAASRFTEKEACSPHFLDEFADRLAGSKPLMEFLTGAIGLPW